MRAGAAVFGAHQLAKDLSGRARCAGAGLPGGSGAARPTTHALRGAGDAARPGGARDRRRLGMANQSIDALVKREFTAGFVTDIESVSLPPGLNEDIFRALSAKKDEPEFLL